MYHHVRRPQLIHERLPDLEMTAQRIERLRAVRQIRLQRVHIRIIEGRLINIENLMAVAEQLLDNGAADDAAPAGDDDALRRSCGQIGRHGYGR